jgi:hypothetical protein
MDAAEIGRIRKAIYRSFGSSPHKKKYWLALLAMYVAAEKDVHRAGGVSRGRPRQLKPVDP